MIVTCPHCKTEISCNDLSIHEMLCSACNKYFLVPKLETKTLEEVVTRIFKDLGCTENLSIEFIKQVLEMVKTFDRKQHDYGSHNIADFGELGVLVRTNDKIRRLKNLQGKGEAKNESIDDTWLDIAVYGVIALLCRKGIWK